MFASQQGDDYNSSIDMWLLTPDNTAIRICKYSNRMESTSINDSNTVARPSFFLKSNVVITGGNGTKNNPFTITLK